MYRSFIRPLALAAGLVLFAPLASAQTVYGLFGLTSPPGNKQMGTLDPTDGNIALLGTSTSIDMNAISTTTGATAVAVNARRMYFIGNESGSDYVYTVNLDDGTLVSRIALSASVATPPVSTLTTSNTMGVWYDEPNAVLYALFIAPGGNREVVSIDPTTGVATGLSGAIGGEAITTASGVFTGDSAGERVFFIGTPASDDPADPGSIYVVSTVDGTETHVMLGDDYDENTIQGIEWDASTDTLWTIVHFDRDHIQRALGYIDPDGGDLTLDFDPLDNGDPISTSSGLIALDPDTQRLFFIGNPDGAPGISIYTVNLSDGTGSYQELTGGGVNPGAMAGIEVVRGPQLSLTKSDGGASAVPGDTISYTLTASNAMGVGDSHTTEIVETVPANTTFNAGASTPGWSCADGSASGTSCVLSLPDLTSGASNVSTFAVDVLSSVSAGTTQISNSATLQAFNAIDSAMASDTTPVASAASLTLTKDDGDASAVPGDTVTYTLTVSNTGNQDTANLVLHETVPDNSSFNSGVSTAGWSCANTTPGSACDFSIGTLGGGSQVMIDFAVDVDNPLAVGVTELSNSASVTADNAGGFSNSDTTPITASPVLGVSISDGGIGAVPGDVVIYAVDYQNSGDQNADSAALAIVIPGQTTFVAAASDAGWDCQPNNSPGSTCTLDIGLLAGAGGNGSADFALVIYDPVDAGTTQIDIGTTLSASNASSANANDSTPIAANPILNLFKGDGGISSVPGASISYALVAMNDGNMSAADTVLSETVPANSSFDASNSSPDWTCLPDGNPGSTCTADIGTLIGYDFAVRLFAVRVDNPVPVGTSQISNSATLDASNAPAPAADSDDTPLSVVVDLHVEKLDGGVTAFAGQPLSYTLNYANNGTQNTLDTTISETVPANTSFNAGLSSAGWSCADGSTAGTACTLDLGELAAGASSAAIFSVDVVSPLPGGVTQLSNTASIGDNGFGGTDANAADNSASIDTPVLTPLLDLAISKVGILDVMSGVADYEIVVESQGNVGDTGSLLSDPLDDPAFDSAAAAWSCIAILGASCPASGSGPLSMTMDLPAGSAATVLLSVPILPGADIEQVFNTATISASTPEDDAVPGNNSATASVGRCLFCDGFEDPQ